MREIRTSGSMSGDGKRDDARVVTAPTLDSTEGKEVGGRQYVVGGEEQGPSGRRYVVGGGILNCLLPSPQGLLPLKARSNIRGVPEKSSGYDAC